MLRDDDPACRDDDDHILVTRNEWLSHLKRYLEHPDEAGGIGSGDNYNEFQFMEGHLRQAEHHCWLYHDLYDHAGLQWEDLLRIGDIRVDLKVIYQHAYDVIGSSPGSGGS